MTNTETLNSYLTFRLGDELFAANVSKVLEILDVPKITKVPRSPDFMLGVINLRGSVLPVIDTRVKFGFQQVEQTVNSSIVVLHVIIDEHEMTIGALTDSVQEVLEIENKDILEAPSLGARYKTEFIQGMVKKDEQFIMILDTDKVFSTTEVTILQELVEQETESKTI